MKKLLLLLSILLLIGFIFIDQFSQSEKITGEIYSGTIIIPGAEKVENLRQSGVECSSFSLYAVSKIFGTDMGSQEEIRDELGPKFWFGIFPFSFRTAVGKYFEYTKIAGNSDVELSKNVLLHSLSAGHPVILLVLHEGYQHYFTLVGVDIENDEWYLYDSLAPRKDFSMTEDLNGDKPGNYSLTSTELHEKWSGGGVVGLRKYWGVRVHGEKRHLRVDGNTDD